MNTQRARRWKLGSRPLGKTAGLMALVCWLIGAGTHGFGHLASAAAAWLGLGLALALTQLPAWAGWWPRRGAATEMAQPAPGSPAAMTAELMLRLDDAARTWTAHLRTVQKQMRDATEQLLQGFGDILWRVRSTFAAVSLFAAIAVSLVGLIAVLSLWN